MMVTVTTRRRDAEVRITETARAFRIALSPKRPELVPTLADITTGRWDSVISIRLHVRIMIRTASATDTGAWAFLGRLVPASEVISLTNKTELERRSPLAFTTNCTTTVRRLRK